MQKRPALLEGWWLTLYTAVSVGSVLLWILLDRPGEEGLLLFLRISARVSVVLFSLAFAASALHRLWKNQFTAWLLRNRRQVGVSFAISHTYHLMAILLLARKDVVGFSSESGPIVMIGGGIGFLFLFAMAATSFDRTARWIGSQNWKRLHTAGMYYLWGIFAFDYLQLVTESYFYISFALLVILAPTLRIVSRLHTAPTGVSPIRDAQ